MDEAFLRSGPGSLSCKGSHVVLHAAEKHAAAIGVPQCIAVVDAAGDLLAFSRMDGARVASVDIAIAKARSAARRSRATADEGDGDISKQLRLAVASGFVITGLPGGLPIELDGRVIGAIGVSSGTSDEDVLVARAGRDALDGSA